MDTIMDTNMDTNNMDTNMYMEPAAQDTSFEEIMEALDAMQLAEPEPRTNMPMEGVHYPLPWAPPGEALDKINDLFQNQINGAILVSIDIVSIVRGEHGDEVELVTITALDTSMLGQLDSPPIDEVWTDIAIDVHNHERGLVFHPDGHFRRTGDRKWGGRHDRLLAALEGSYKEGRKIVLVGSDVVARCFLPGFRSDMFSCYQDVLTKLFWISDCVLELSHPPKYVCNSGQKEVEESSLLLRLAGKALCNEGFEEVENEFVDTFTSRIIAQRKLEILDLALALRLGTEGEWEIMLDRESLETDVDMQEVDADVDQMEEDDEKQDVFGANCVKASCAMESLVTSFEDWMLAPQM